MAKRQKKQKQGENEPEFNLDKIIEEESSELHLTPTNLERDSHVKHAVSTGSLSLDLVTGGGFPPSRRSNVFGREAVGKSTFMYFALKNCIEQGVHAVFYDFEGSTESDRIERIGVKIEWLKEMEANQPVLFRYYDRMKHGEQMFRHARRILERMPDVDEGPVRLAFFCDSLPATVPQAKAEDDENKANALRASMFSENLPLIKSLVAAKRAIWIDTNQLRTNPRNMFGKAEYEPCGEAVRTFSDVRIRAKKAIPPGGRGLADNKTYIEVEKCWDGVGHDRYNFADLFVIKNKAFSPNRGCTVRIWFEEAGKPGRGIDPVFDVYEYLRLTGQIKYHRKMYHILMDPFDKEHEVKIPVYDPETKDSKINPETGEVLFQTETRTAWTWGDFKSLILNPMNYTGKGRKQWDIVAACRKQFQDGIAFKMYFDNLVAQSMIQELKQAE